MEKMEKNDSTCLQKLCNMATEAVSFVRQYVADITSEEGLLSKDEIEDMKEETERQRLQKIDSRITRLTAFPREQEILKEIFSYDPQLKEEELKSIRRDYDLNGAVFLEYQHQALGENVFDGNELSKYVATYIYYDERCQEIDLLFGKRRWKIHDAPRATVLLKIDRKGNKTELCHWNNN